MRTLSKVSLAAILLLVFFTVPAAYADPPKFAKPLRDMLPCVAPDGEYPFMVIEYNAENKIAFVLRCESEGEAWELMLLADQPDNEEKEKP